MDSFKDVLKDIDKYSNEELLEIFVGMRGMLKGLLTVYKPSNRKEKDLLDVIEVYNEIIIKKLKECKGEWNEQMW